MNITPKKIAWKPQILPLAEGDVILFIESNGNRTVLTVQECCADEHELNIITDDGDWFLSKGDRAYKLFNINELKLK